MANSLPRTFRYVRATISTRNDDLASACFSFAFSFLRSAALVSAQLALDDVENDALPRADHSGVNLREFVQLLPGAGREARRRLRTEVEPVRQLQATTKLYIDSLTNVSASTSFCARTLWQLATAPSVRPRHSRHELHSKGDCRH